MRIRHLTRAAGAWLRYAMTGRAPFSVTLDLTHRCTGNCVFCQIQDDASQEMTTDQIKTAIDQFHSLGTARMAFTGGDVLLRDDLAELIDHAKGKGVFTSVNSNGNLALERYELIAGADMLVFSLDGDPPRHVQTKRGTDPEKILGAIELAGSRGQAVSTITVLTSQNLGTIDWILETGKKMGFSVTFQPVLRCDMSPDLAERLVPSAEDQQRAVEGIVRAAHAGYPVMNSNRYLRMLAKGEIKPRDAKPKCLAGKFYCTVLPDGAVVPCHGAFKRSAFKNGVEAGFDRAFLEMPEFSCEGCLSTAYTELDLLAAGSAGLVWRALRQAI